MSSSRSTARTGTARAGRGTRTGASAGWRRSATSASPEEPADSASPAAERELVARFLARRDEDSFRDLYRRHAPALWRFLARLCGAAGAEDAFQDTWLRAVERLEGFRGESGLRTWLFGIAWNRAREAWRGSREEPAPGEEVAEALDARRAADERLAGALDETTAERVEAALARLAPGYRVAVLLHDVEGRTHAEIGSMLGVSPGASKSQLSRARRALRRLLAAEHGADVRGEVRESVREDAREERK